MGILISILSILAANVPWGELIKLAMQLIKKQAPEVEAGKKTGVQAREENIAVMQEVTTQSPPLPDFALLIAHEAAWIEYLKENIPEKYEEYKQRIEGWITSWMRSKTYDPDYVESVSDNVFGTMELYTSRPDKKGES